MVTPVPSGHHLNLPGKGKVGEIQDMTEHLPPGTAGSLPPARSQVRWLLCKGDSHTIVLSYKYNRKPDFPLGVWKIQKEGGSRLTDSVSQNERIP